MGNNWIHNFKLRNVKFSIVSDLNSDHRDHFRLSLTNALKRWYINLRGFSWQARWHWCLGTRINSIHILIIHLIDFSIYHWLSVKVQREKRIVFCHNYCILFNKPFREYISSIPEDLTQVPKYYEDKILRNVIRSVSVLWLWRLFKGNNLSFSDGSDEIVALKECVYLDGEHR